jgi:hypothetical protein
MFDLQVNYMLPWWFHFQNEIPINCSFTYWKCTYILDFRPWRWSALNMGFVVKWPCPHTSVFGHCSVPVLQCSGDLGLGHCELWLYLLPGGGGMDQAPSQGPPATVATREPVVRYSRHKIDTLGGVFCFLGCPRTPKSQTGCPWGHPKILQGCHFDTQKKLRVSPVLVGPMALNFILIKCFPKKV